MFGPSGAVLRHGHLAPGAKAGPQVAPSPVAAAKVLTLASQIAEEAPLMPKHRGRRAAVGAGGGAAQLSGTALAGPPPPHGGDASKGGRKAPKSKAKTPAKAVDATALTVVERMNNLIGQCTKDAGSCTSTIMKLVGHKYCDKATADLTECKTHFENKHLCLNVDALQRGTFVRPSICSLAAVILAASTRLVYLLTSTCPHGHCIHVTFHLLFDCSCPYIIGFKHMHVDSVSKLMHKPLR